MTAKEYVERLCRVGEDVNARPAKESIPARKARRDVIRKMILGGQKLARVDK